VFHFKIFDFYCFCCCCWTKNLKIYKKDNIFGSPLCTHNHETSVCKKCSKWRSHQTIIFSLQNRHKFIPTQSFHKMQFLKYKKKSPKLHFHKGKCLWKSISTQSFKIFKRISCEDMIFFCKKFLRKFFSTQNLAISVFSEV
jgi:hypothetical protein